MSLSSQGVSKYGWVNRLFQSTARPAGRRRRRERPADPAVEALETRILPAITAFFSPGSGVLTVIGDAQDNTIGVSQNGAGVLRVNGGTVPIAGGTATVANTTQIQIFGQAGHDWLVLDEDFGAVPRALIVGSSGNDVLIGGSAADMLFGQSGNDTLLGRGGTDLLSGGSENDHLTGGDADDQVFGDSGHDQLVWNPGDDTDLNEGGLGTDAILVNGGNGDEVFTATANGARVRFDRLTPSPFALDIGTSENLVVNMNGGNDSFSATGNLAALIKITVDGGAGNDTVLGSNGADVLLGGAGNDFIDGQQGNDVAFLGAGDDVFQWDPGDGSDIVEGQAGIDVMRFNGSAGDEIFNAAANGQRVLFTRNLGNIVMDLNDVEGLVLNALGGADTVVVGDLSGTDLIHIDVNLAGLLGGAAGDGLPDTVIVNGTNGDDVIFASGDANGTLVLGLAALVNITGAEAANDRLVLNSLAGDDVVEASGLASDAIQLTADGGNGDDVLIGGDGDDVLLGGLDDDVLFGGPGIDVLDGGLGDNILIQG